MITITKNKIYRSPFSLKKTKSDSKDVEEIKSPDVIYALGDEVEFGEDVTFKNIFDLIIFHKEFLNILFTKEMHGFVIDDFIADYEKDFELAFDKEGFNLRLSWQSEVFEYDNEVEFLEYTSFEAFGKLDIEEDEEDYPISIAFVSLSEIRNKLVFLDNTFELHDEESYANDIGALFKANYKAFTMYDIFSSVLREISFYGKPEQRDAQRKELEKRAQEFEDLIFEEGEGGLVSWDDLSDEIDEMLSTEYDDKDNESFWDKIYPKQKLIGTSTQDKIDTAIIALSSELDMSLEEQLQDAHDSEDYEKAAKLKKLIDKRDGKVK